MPFYFSNLILQFALFKTLQQNQTTYNAKIKLSDTGQITFVSFVNVPKKAKKVGNKA
ncbi:hypothetical protein [Enterococcus lactis]|uniref:hypothetical protein n=1 Tax=Enterococcus lactis TaxID=357441 RepID=UPI0022E291DB|nr:hypothetical protein [Enterococcus lactis]